MTLRIALSTIASRPFTLDESQLDGPDPLGSWTATSLVHDIVEAAAVRASRGDTEILDARAAVETEHIDALVWDQSAYMDDLPVLKWPVAPSAFLEILPGHSDVVTMNEAHGVHITVGELDQEAAVDALADWLQQVSSPTITAEEGQQIEIVLGAVREVLEEGRFARLHPDDAAQLQGIYDAVQALTKVPRPPRRILGWAMGEIGQITTGYIAGLATTYLPHLIQVLR